MKIALIFARYKYQSGDIPLGIGYITAYIKKNSNCQIDIIDTTFNTNDEFVINKIKTNDYDLIGFSLMTTMLEDSLRLATKIKKINPSNKIIFGGPHPTVMPDETLKNECVDAVCIGEGEETMLRLVKNNLNFENIDGLWYKKQNQIIRNAPRKPIENIDNLPFPEKKLFDTDKYFSYWFQLDSVAKNFKGVNIISSRGCPYRCTYCQPTLETIFGKKIRRRSSKNIVDELEYLKNEYGINAFMFQDDTFVTDHKWVTEICDELEKRKLDLSWGCNARVNLVTKELIAKMTSTGLKKIFIGIESASQRILDEIYHKQITTQQIISAVKIFKEFGLRIQGFFMIGAPTETPEEINQTIKFARQLDIDEATFSITTPLPHTHLYETIKTRINKDIKEFDYYKRSVFKHETLSEKQLNYFKKKALLNFYLSPKRIIRTLKGFTTITAIRKSAVKLKRF